MRALYSDSGDNYIALFRILELYSRYKGEEVGILPTEASGFFSDYKSSIFVLYMLKTDSIY